MTEKLRSVYIFVAISGLLMMPTALRAETWISACIMVMTPLVICGALTLIRVENTDIPVMEFHFFMLKATFLILLGMLAIAKMATPTTWRESIIFADMAYGLGVGIIGIPFLAEAKTKE